MTDVRSQDDRAVDEPLEETFPASDAPAHTVETGIRIGDAEIASGGRVTDNRVASRFELTVGDATAFLLYERAPGVLTLVHTQVPPYLRGRHLGERLAEAALEAGRSEGRRIVAVCPFVRSYLRKRRLAAATPA